MVLAFFYLLMPYKAFHIDDEFCVFKLDDDDNRTGSSLGCHPTLAEANEQVAALFAAEEEERSMDKDERARSLFDKFLSGIKSLFAPDTPSESERAISGERVRNALWQRMFDLDAEITGSDHYLVDMYFDEGGVYALYVDRGKLFRYQIVVQDDEIALGERIEVMEIHQPVQARTVIRQQEDGRHRWFSVSGTAVLNRSGEIDSRDLFDSCVAYAQETGKYPIRMFFHQGTISRDWEMDASARAFKTGQADFLARDGYCYLTSGLYDETPLALAEIQARQNDPAYWGDSIGFWPTAEPELTEISDGIKIPVYHEGFNVEITTLPEFEASHLFTRTEVRMTLQNREWEAFLALWGNDEEAARKWLEEHPEARNRAIEQAGMITRDGDGEGAGTENNAEEGGGNEDPNAAPAELVVDDSVIGAVVAALAIDEVPITDVLTGIRETLTGIETQLAERTEMGKAQSATIALLTKRLEVLEGTEAATQQQLADDTPAKFNGTPTRVVYRPRQANAALVEDGEAYSEKASRNTPKAVGY